MRYEYGTMNKLFCVGSGGWLLNAIRTVQGGSKACVKINEIVNEWFSTEQGDLGMSPWLYIVC